MERGIERRLLALNVILQAADGLLTFVGVSRGIREGNPLIAASIEYFGLAAALVGTKAFCCVAILAARRERRILQMVAATWTVAVIFPWAMVIWARGV